MIVDDLAPTLSKGAPNQKLILTLNSKNYTSITNSSGFAIFEIPTKNLKNGNYSFQIKHPTSNISTSINITGILEIFNKETNNNENNNKNNSNINNEDTSRNSTNIIEMENNPKKAHSKLLSSGDTSDIVIYSDNPYIKIDTSTSSKNKNDIDKMFFGLFKDYADDFYKKFPYAKNRTDANMLFISYLYKEFSHDLLTNPNSFPSIYPIALGLDLYVVGAFAEAYVACNGSIIGFLKYPFFHDPQYNKFMDATFGEYSPWIKGILEFAIGIDTKGNMSIAQFIINILSLLGVGLWEKIGSRINKFYMIIKGGKYGRYLPRNYSDLGNIFSGIDVVLQLASHPYNGVTALAYKFTKFFSNKFDLISFLSKGSENKLIIMASHYVNQYLDNSLRSFLNIFNIDYENIPSNIKKAKKLSKKRPLHKNNETLSKGNKAVYRKNKKSQTKFIKRIIKKVSKKIPKKVKTIIKEGIKELSRQLGISKKNNNKKIKHTRKQTKKTKNNKSNNAINKIKNKTKQVINKIKNRTKKAINKIKNKTKGLIKKFKSFIK